MRGWVPAKTVRHLPPGSAPLKGLSRENIRRMCHRGMCLSLPERKKQYAGVRVREGGRVTESGQVLNKRSENKPAPDQYEYPMKAVANLCPANSRGVYVGYATDTITYRRFPCLEFQSVVISIECRHPPVVPQTQGSEPIRYLPPTPD